MDTNPVIRFSANIWTTMGYIYPKDQRRCISFINYTCIIILQFNFLLYSGDGIEKITSAAFLSFLNVNILVELIKPNTISH